MAVVEEGGFVLERIMYRPGPSDKYKQISNNKGMITPTVKQALFNFYFPHPNLKANREHIEHLTKEGCTVVGMMSGELKDDKVSVKRVVVNEKVFCGPLFDLKLPSCCSFGQSVWRCILPSHS